MHRVSIKEAYDNIDKSTSKFKFDVYKTFEEYSTAVGDFIDSFTKCVNFKNHTDEDIENALMSIYVLYDQQTFVTKILQSVENILKTALYAEMLLHFSGNDKQIGNDYIDFLFDNGKITSNEIDALINQGMKKIIERGDNDL